MGGLDKQSEAAKSVATMSLRLVVDLEFEPDLWYEEDNDDDKAWFYHTIMGGDNLQLIDSGDVGDIIGKIKVIDMQPSDAKAKKRQAKATNETI